MVFKRIRRGLSNLGPRGKTAIELRRIRRLDQAAYGGKAPHYPVSTGVKEYGAMFNTDFYGAVQKSIARGRKPKVLEVSAGEGRFLRELKDRFGHNITTVATGLARPPKTKGIDSYRVMRLGNQKRPLSGGFDFIVAVSGEPQKMSPGEVTDHVLSRLRPGGKAYLDLGMLQLAHGKVTTIEGDTKGFFEDQGFRVLRVLHTKAVERVGNVTLMEIERPR
ncbi:MAG: hypothetical protein JXB14_06340 [Candidatus Altiarchaeota archaeon]|nr:hypothetical protein [Candidatus Altiarchaeota archaeon]